MAVILNPTPFKLKSKRLQTILNFIVNFPASNHYYRLKASKHYDELTLQRIFKYKIESLLPSYSTIYYNKRIVSSINKFDKCIPDFLIWKNDYSEWIVVEVEMENHQISHIDKQLRTFYNGDYSDINSITTYIKSKMPTLDESKFKNLITNNRPKLMLVSDIIHCGWETHFAQYDCIFSTLQVYGDRDDNFMYRVGGNFPQEFSQYTYGTLDKFTKSLNIDFKDFFVSSGFTNEDEIDIYYNGNLYKWKLLLTDKKTQIMFFEDYMPIDLTVSKWRLIINKKGQFHLIK